ncbi:hypothetical protein NC651_017324 [Populus alba x Populus x berolinensis]|nr:hypothetical protein NC651_017324 [Populus alba x Populus x berolinensis]
MESEPLHRSTTLNYQAATRFIEHSLPDLTPEQRKSMRNISKGEGPKIKYTERSTRKKRKCDTSEKQSVQAAAQEFLEKAARELFGGNADGFKGPLIKTDSSSEDNLPDFIDEICQCIMTVLSTVYHDDGYSRASLDPPQSINTFVPLPSVVKKRHNTVSNKQLRLANFSRAL